MQIQYRLLGNRRRLAVRDVARKAFHQAEGDERRAKEIAAAEMQSIVASILIGIAVKLAVELIVYWIKNRFATVPSGEFVEGEPGA